MERINNSHLDSQLDSPMEVECKYRIESLSDTKQAIEVFKATFIRREHHCDTYLRHPSRDFRSTDEALRIREIDGKPYITYKGPRMAGPIKIRPEIELPLASDTLAGWIKIWGHLGFTVSLEVRKSREVYELETNARVVTIALDHVESLGDYVEIERIAMSRAEISIAQQDIQDLARQLNLTQVESRSYLGLLLAKLGQK